MCVLTSMLLVDSAFCHKQTKYSCQPLQPLQISIKECLGYIVIIFSKPESQKVTYSCSLLIFQGYRDETKNTFDM
jgi:hypothetical protein